MDGGKTMKTIIIKIRRKNTKAISKEVAGEWGYL